jgi:multidrug efflux system membrane fusion protein
MKRLLIALVGLALIGGGALWYRDHERGAAPAGHAVADLPPAPVVVDHVQRRAVPLVLASIGRVQAINNVSIKPRIEGQILAVHFTEGQDVKVGDLLFTLDTRGTEITLQEAMAALARDQAQLASAQADLKRYSELAKTGYGTAQKQEQSVASAGVLDAAIKADNAAVARAQLDLEYASIRSPIEGRTGAVPVKVGNVVKPTDTTPLVTITQIRPITVAFTLPERYFPALKRYQAVGPLAVKVKVPHGNEAGIAGRLTFIDNAIDSTSGTIGAKATFDNADGVLWPGAFVTVALTLTVEPDALVVPLAAVQTGQDGRFVFVVKAGSTVEVRPVKVAREADDQAVIGSGLAEGETVVVEGQLRLSPGTRVVARPAKPAPAAGSAPGTATEPGS